MDVAASTLERFSLAILAGYFAFYFLFSAFGNYTLQSISDKTDAAPSWVAWIPLIQIHAFVRAVGTSYLAMLAWIGGIIGLAIVGAVASGEGPLQGVLALLVMTYALVSVVWFVTLFWRLAVRRGLSGWVGLACFIPLLGLLFYLYIAFHDGFVRPSGIGLAVTAGLGLLAVFGLQNDLEQLQAFLEGDHGAFSQDLPQDQRDQLALLMAQFGESLQAAASGATDTAGRGNGVVDRLLARAAGSVAPGYAEDIAIPDAISCEPGTRLAGARPPDGSAMWCERSHDGTKHGWHLGWYGNGQIQEAGRYVEGRRDGVWTRFWLSGGRKAQVNFERDREHGILVLWDEFGRVEREIRYVDGEPGAL